jgi:hypothetical protein
MMTGIRAVLSWRFWESPIIHANQQVDERVRSWEVDPFADAIGN